jgi:hypothetical protein
MTFGLMIASNSRRSPECGSHAAATGFSAALLYVLVHFVMRRLMPKALAW